MISEQNITQLFLQRQHFIQKADFAVYDELFRKMSPVSTLYWTRPGDPPVLVHRTDFDDLKYNDKKRSNREIVKMRLLKSGVGYIRSDELELFAGIYRTNLGKFTKQEYDLLELLSHEGSMNIHELKSVTGMLVKDLTPILHRLQEAFLVYEDQRDSEWDRSWYAFENEFPDIDVKRYTKTAALKIALMRFAEMTVFFDADMAKSFYRVPKKEIESAIDELVAEKQLISRSVGEKAGYLRAVDAEYLQNNDIDVALPSVLVMHRSDFIIKCQEEELKKKYKDPKDDILYYLLIDGKVQGALYGRFTFGPVELRQIKIDLPVAQILFRRSTILAAIAAENDFGEHVRPLVLTLSSNEDLTRQFHEK